MCKHEGVRLTKVTIVSDENTAGSCGYESMIRGKYRETDNSDRTRVKMEKRAMIALAGPLAQRLYSPRSFRNYHASADYKAAARIDLVRQSTRRARRVRHIGVEQREAAIETGSSHCCPMLQSI